MEHKIEFCSGNGSCYKLMRAHVPGIGFNVSVTPININLNTAWRRAQVRPSIYRIRTSLEVQIFRAN